MTAAFLKSISLKVVLGLLKTDKTICALIIMSNYARTVKYISGVGMKSDYA